MTHVCGLQGYQRGPVPDPVCPACATRELTRPVADIDDPACRADPTEADLADPWFEAIWQAIKGWDVSPTSNGLYSGATGTDVMIVLRAIRPLIAANAQDCGQ